jgi:alkylation response protein AidB-like acyl-CoA dehydrogenase
MPMLDLPDNVRRFRDTVAEFVRERVAPGAADRDRKREFPADLWAEVGSRGWLGVIYPRDLGGMGLDYLHYATLIEEVASADGSLALMMGAHMSLCTGHIAVAGSDEQKKRLIPRLASGQVTGSWALTEPEAGSDAGGVRTQATPASTAAGEGWALNGEKCYITMGNRASVQVVIASTDPLKGKDGLTAFVFERPAPGFEAGPEAPTVGMCSSDTARIRIRDLRLPRSAQLGKRGEAFKDTMRVLDGGRIGVGAVALGLARAALDASVRHASHRKQFGKPLGEFQSVGNMLADMATEIEAARALLYRTADRRDRGVGTSRDSSMAKMFASRVATKACDLAIQIHGGHGYTHACPVERFWRDARLTEIGEGTTQIQQLVIARYLLRDAR